MNSILSIYVSLTLNVAAQYTEVLIMTLDLTLDISKQPTLHDQVHYSLRIKSLCKNCVVRFIIRLLVVRRIINLTVGQFNMS